MMTRGCDPEVVGMTRGARFLGDIGCLGDPDRRRRSGNGLPVRFSGDNSALSSKVGPVIRDTMVSPKTLCFQE